ncbi:MAG TPA: radical SAM protein, partial [Myxococcota bacterium]|nr:radical SAM protein [Myxococcota bacterium]
GGELEAHDFAALISPAAVAVLERAARAAHRATAERFGKTILLYAPLYLSNECISTCVYCGFSRENAVARRTLTLDETLAEARTLAARGFHHLLLVTGEHPKAASLGSLCEAVAALRAAGVASVSVEIAPLDVGGYRALALAGTDGLVVYQETYDRETYGRVHLGGPKRDYDWRLADWRAEAIALFAHARFLLRDAWRCALTVSLPRLRPAAGDYAPAHPVSDRDLVQLLVALRLALPDVGIAISTRESPTLRDRLVPLGVTQMSAGSRTEPGGYSHPREAEPQFEVEDTRTPEEVAAAIARLGYDPVWKDWEEALHERAG